MGQGNSFWKQASLSNALFNPDKVKSPKIPPTPDYDAQAAAKAAQASALKKKQGAKAAQGLEDTIKTSPSGLGAIGSQYQGTKTLTGT